MNTCRPLFPLLALLLGGPAAAAEDASPVPPGWYAAPMLTYFKPDSERCGVGSDSGASLALGHRGDIASLELWGQFLSVGHDGCTYTMPGPATDDPTDDETVTVTEPAGTLKLDGVGLTLVVGPFADMPVLSGLHGLIGFGVIQRENHPQYEGDDTTIFGDVGLAYLHPVSLFDLPFALRLDARYRYDVQQPPHPDEQEPAPPHAYSDLVVNLGIQFALSAPSRPAPPPAEEPVQVVPAQENPSQGEGN